MFLSKKQARMRLALFIIITVFAAFVAWAVLYYPNIHTLNSHQGYKGIFI